MPISFGISQGTVSEIITEFTPLIAQATEEFRPDAVEAKEMNTGSVSAGRRHVVAMLVMGERPRPVGREIRVLPVMAGLIISNKFGNIIIIIDLAHQDVTMT